MAIYLDDAILDAEADLTLSEILKAADTISSNKGHLVVEVTIDGEQKYGGELAELLGEQMTDKEVKIVSAHRQELAVQTLDQVRAALDAARSAQSEAAELFQKDDPEGAMVKVSEALETWQATQQAVGQTTKLMDVDIDKIKVGEESAQKVVEMLLDRLTEMKELIQGGDTVALADVLAYEWPEVTDQWEQLVGLLIAEIS